MPTGLDRLRHVVVLMMSGRSFDHMLGGLKAIDSRIDGLTGTESNADTAGGVASVQPRAEYQGQLDPDPGHDFAAVDLQIFNGDTSTSRVPTMQGFVKSYFEKRRDLNHSHQIMYYFAPDKLPVLTTLAREFAVFNRWFSSVPGPALCNRAFAHYGTSFGHVGMEVFYANQKFKSIYERLEAAGKKAKIYYFDTSSSSLGVVNLMQQQPQLFGTFEQFLVDCDKGTLPDYSFVEPNYSDHQSDTGAAILASDQHPDHHVLEGERFIASVYNAIRQNSGLWASTALLITYDTHGGTYDHVPPPSCPPDGFAALPVETKTPAAFLFDRLGLRVPAVLISPWIPKGTVVNDVFEHASIPATLTQFFLATYDERSPREKTASAFLELLSLPAMRADAPEFALKKGAPAVVTASSGADVVPFGRLADFETFDSIPFLMNRAAEMASGPTQPIPVSTSCVLFALTESTNTEGHWTAHFMREFIDQHSNTYETTRDSYFRRKGSRGLKPGAKRGSVGARGSVAMTGYLYAALGRARDIAQRTTRLEMIHARHLVAALLQEDPQKTQSGVLARLSEMGIDAGAMREALFDHVSGKGDDDATWAALLLKSTPPRRRLVGFSTDRVGGRDLLKIESDVLALSALIAARTVEPPLSIGLFGEWGSGKTFFMRELRSSIERLSREARAERRMQRELPFYKNIVQIEFNAWHYVEGNLWASLVEHILANLYVKEDPLVSRRLQESLIKKLAEEKTLAQATSNAVDSAKAATSEAKQELDDAQDQLHEKTLELAELNATRAGRDFILTGAHQPVVDALHQLGFAAVGESAVELEGALRQIHDVLGRGQRFLAPLTRANDRGRRFTWLLLSLLGAPVMVIIVRLALQKLGSSVSDIYAYATGLATLIASGVPWLKRQADWMARRLDEAEKAQKAFDSEIAKETALHVRRVTEAEQKLRELTATLDAAMRRHAEAKGREAAADAELKAATTGRLLANFITDRAASSDYRKHLGVLALVRDDFEKLSGLIEEENWRLSPDDPNEPPRLNWPAKFSSLSEEDQDKEKRINRIVLYIDDLDRCPPNKVIEVLQAVHLLLAFPLFVVVVGVDARWITRSLQAKYRELLLIGDKQPSDEDNAGVFLGSATPNDYLEKIFQIPFWLKQMDASASDRMVRGLLRPSVAPADRDSIESSPTPSADDAATPRPPRATPADGENASSQMNQSGAVGADTATAHPTSSDATDTTHGVTESSGHTDVAQPVTLSLESLEIVKAELDYITKLAPVLGRSPRALKRFANVYRLIKVGLFAHEQRAFLRERSPLSHYQAVLFLLAVDTGAPMIARSFFALVDRGASVVEGDTSKGQRQADLAWLVKQMDGETKLEDPVSWQRLRSWLTSTKNGAVPLTTELSLLSAWSRRVGRYSFEVGRA